MPCLCLLCVCMCVRVRLREREALHGPDYKYEKSVFSPPSWIRVVLSTRPPVPVCCRARLETRSISTYYYIAILRLEREALHCHVCEIASAWQATDCFPLKVCVCGFCAVSQYKEGNFPRPIKVKFLPYYYYITW